jgi:hypothetical protein
MSNLREIAKRHLPAVARRAIIAARKTIEAPPLEEIVLHSYKILYDASSTARISLVIPTLSPEKFFGGVATAIDLFLALGARTGADLRIVMDDFDAIANTSELERRAKKVGIDSSAIEVVGRTERIPVIGVRRGDIFVTYNWWTTLNIEWLLQEYCRSFDAAPAPHIYLIQEYEPGFYPMSSTHMAARLALGSGRPWWAIFNSHELYEYFLAQGHGVEKAFLFEPALSTELRGYLDLPRPPKERKILVYGRPNIPRNCFPAVCKGLTQWVRDYPEADKWEVISAGHHHSPIPLGRGCTMASSGKLAMGDYGKLLLKTAVGLSLMASPHPSYPPLEMAHFGILTLTNKYANKDLGNSHENIRSLDDIAPDTIARALVQACRQFEQSPDIGWNAQSLRASFLRPQPMDFIDALSESLFDRVWAGL